MIRALPLIFGLVTFVGASGQTQTAPDTAPQAPREVDAALRARITQFYQLEVEGKFHQAEQLVAEDTKDLFVGVSKPIFYAFEIFSIKYGSDFTTAEVLVRVTRLVPVEGFTNHPVITKMGSRWKLENGQWCYYVDPALDLRPTPFPGASGPPGITGPRTIRPPVPPAAPAANHPAVPAATPPAAPPQPASVVPGMPVPQAAPIAVTPGSRPLPPMPAMPPIPTVLTVDKLTVEFKFSAPSSDRVVITNPTPFAESLMLTEPKIAGLAVKLDKLTLQTRDKATLSIQWSGAGQAPPHATIFVKVPQTNQVIPIKVTFVK